MISDFIYKYYIDPVKYGEPYNIVETLTYAIILIIGVYLLYRWFSNSTWLSEHGIKLDSSFILATLPYVVLGGVLRVIQDAGMVDRRLAVPDRHPSHLFCAVLLYARDDLYRGHPEEKWAYKRLPVILCIHRLHGGLCRFAYPAFLGDGPRPCRSLHPCGDPAHGGHCFGAGLGLHEVCPLLGICAGSALYCAHLRADAGRQCHQLRAYLPPCRSLHRAARGRVKPDRR